MFLSRNVEVEEVNDTIMRLPVRRVLEYDRDLSAYKVITIIPTINLNFSILYLIPGLRRIQYRKSLQSTPS